VSGIYITSELYPLLVQEHFATVGAMIPAPVYAYADVLGSTAALLSGDLIAYVTDDEETSETMSASAALLSAEMTYYGALSYAAPGDTMSSGATLQSGSLDLALINYLNWTPDHLQSSAQLLGGTLL